MYPRSKKRPPRFLRTIIRKSASIGANATILPGLEIGTGALVGAGAVVTMSVPPFAVVAGNPARIIRYIGSAGRAKKQAVSAPKTRDRYLYALKKAADMRGSLSVAEFAKELPFIPKRYFVVYDVPSEKIRGQHAHKKCGQFLVCVKGSVRAAVDDGKIRKEYVLDRPDLGLYIPPMAWASQYNYSGDAVLLVFASRPYEEDDYIRDYGVWRRALRVRVKKR